MSIVRWDPFRELEDMSDRLSRLVARPRGETTLGDWTPAVDIAETPTEYLIKAEIPEVKKEDIKVRVENGVLSLEGERKIEREEKGKRFHRTERMYGRFVRSFGLPDDVDPSKVSADFKDGMLVVHVAKAPAPTAKSIEVKIS